MVREIMTPNPMTVPAGASLIDAARMMRDHGVGDVLVTEGGSLCGVVTDRDIVIRALAEGRDPRSTGVEEICSPELTTVHPDADSDEVVRLMRERAIRRVPVVEDHKAIGIISLGDLAVEKDPRSALADISAAPPTH